MRMSLRAAAVLLTSVTAVVCAAEFPLVTGQLVTGLLTAGAFAAFLGTSLGLLLAMSGAISHDLAPSSVGRLRVETSCASTIWKSICAINAPSAAGFR